MAQRLNKAEINENVTSLQEDHEFNLEGAMMKCFNWTPLHVAASRGHHELFQTLLSRNLELAEALDSQQRSLLHLASANGHIEIVKALIQVRPEMCLARDRDGANPLHVAAMRGKVEVLDELFKANPHAARARVDSGERETILHLCVKYNQLQFLKMLLEKYFKGEEFVNATDNAGNTILHLAVAIAVAVDVADRRYEIIKHVLCCTTIDVNATNSSKQTALDILCLGQEKGTEPEEVDKNIHDLLKEYHAERADNAAVRAYNAAEIREEKDQIIVADDAAERAYIAAERAYNAAERAYNDAQKAYNDAEIRDEKNQIIVAAVLLATLAFQAGVTPPGGVWQDDLDGHKSGKAVIASTHPVLYMLFLWFNTSGFIFSLLTLVLVMTNRASKPVYYWLTSVAKISTITSIATAYFISIFMVSPLHLQKHDRRAVSRFGYIDGIIVLMYAVGFTLMLQVIANVIMFRRIKRSLCPGS